MKTPYCSISGCRFPFAHISIHHKFGTCGIYGHGTGSHLEISINEKNNNITEVPKNIQCTNIHCKHKYGHTSLSHNVEFIYDEYNKKRPICNILIENDMGHYIVKIDDSYNIINRYLKEDILSHMYNGFYKKYVGSIIDVKNGIAAKFYREKIPIPRFINYNNYIIEINNKLY